MNRSNKGFSLIEFMIYNVVGYLLLIILFAAVWSVHRSLSRQQVRNRDKIVGPGPGDVFGNPGRLVE